MTSSQYVFTLPQLPPLSTLAPPLTVKNILTSVQGVSWRSLGEKIIPARIYDEITSQHHSDDDCLHSVVQHFLHSDGVDKEPSWRRIIWALDHANETNTASDPIRHFAEPLPGKSCDSIPFLQCISPASHKIVLSELR